jgi:hypothetical protein
MGETVNMRRLENRVSGTTQCVGSLVVGHKNNNVRPFTGLASSEKATKISGFKCDSQGDKQLQAGLGHGR